MTPAGPVIAACLKWVDRKPEVDALTGAVTTDSRTSGLSDADRAALEWALRLGEARGRPVVAVSAGPAAVDVVLREAVAAGATDARRADVAPGAPSAVVAAALTAALPAAVEVVMCGVWSLDRGSGSVPAFLAAERGAAQALGLVHLEVDPGGGLLGERRLDQGRRERLRIPLPAVCSVEGGSARLRRAGLGGVLASAEAPITVWAAPGARPGGPEMPGGPGGPEMPGGPGGSWVPDAPIRTRPYRPRAKELPAPAAELSARERVLALTGALTDRDPPQTLELTPAQAADELLARLHSWGYLP